LPGNGSGRALHHEAAPRVPGRSYGENAGPCGRPDSCLRRELSFFLCDDDQGRCRTGSEKSLRPKQELRPRAAHRLHLRLSMNARHEGLLPPSGFRGPLFSKPRPAKVPSPGGRALFLKPAVGQGGGPRPQALVLLPCSLRKAERRARLGGASSQGEAREALMSVALRVPTHAKVAAQPSCHQSPCRCARANNQHKNTGASSYRLKPCARTGSPNMFTEVGNDAPVRRPGFAQDLG